MVDTRKNNKHTECRVAVMTVSGRKKRVLKYINHRNKSQRLLVVGPKGGISYKSPNNKTRRYVRKQCKNTMCSSTFWDEVDRMAKKQQKSKKSK